MKTLKVRRSEFGHQMADFAAALALLILLVLIPLVNIAVVPVRYGIASALVSDMAYKLSQAQTFSKAVDEFESRTSLFGPLAAIGGVEVKSLELSLLIDSLSKGKESFSIVEPKSVPRDFLPDGAKAPCIYFISVKANLKIYPLISSRVFSSEITGINAPISFTIQRSTHWQNLARDPYTNQFYLNE